MSSSLLPRHEEVLVLFASQTGNSEQAAMEIASQIPSKLSTANLQVTAKPMQLDDFLELRHAKWTRLVVIVTSSYGVGQAPLGGYRFRDFCDTVLLLQDHQQNEGMMLQGLYFALLGLGDSKYTTFFRNPTVTNDALTSVGATRVGDLGKADASAKDQQAIIQQWINGVWPSLKVALQKNPLSDERLTKMQHDTIQLCQTVDPEFLKEPTKIPLHLLLMSIVVALLGVAYYYYYSKYHVMKE